MSVSVLDSLRGSYTAKRTALDEILKPGGELRNDEMSPDEDKRVGGLLAELAALDERITDLAALEERDNKRAAGALELGKGETPVESVRVISEPQVYTADSGNEWVSDCYRAQFCADQQAQDRLNRYAQENHVLKRDVGTSAFGSLIPPGYLTEQYAAVARAGRPTANACTRLPLPTTGMVFTVPRGTTGTVTDVQTAELTDVAETDFDETPLNISVITVAGQQDISRQALERGEGIDRLIFADLTADYAAKVNREVLVGTGVGGHAVGIAATAGINTVAYTDATPTLPELWRKLADGIQQINTFRTLPPTAVIMSPRRWGAFTAETDSTGRPIFGAKASGSTLLNSMATGDAAATGGVVGEAHGLPVIVDPGMATNLGGGTNEDAVFIARMPDLLLWEQNGGNPRELRFEDANSSKLAVKVVVYGFMAFTAARYPKAITVVSGTGLVPPVF